MARARRRSDKERLKHRARRLYPSEQLACRNADNRTPCSCWMCGNPRRHHGEQSVQERRASEPE